MTFKKIFTAAGVVAAIWVGVKYLLPVALPFLLGLVLALAAEPLVRPVATRLPRGAAAGIGVTATLLGLTAILCFVGAVAVRELGELAGAIPALTGTARQGIQLLEDWLVSLSDQAPEELRPALQKTVLNIFDDGTVLLQQVSQRVPGAVTTAISGLGQGALGVGTGVVSAFLISGRLPKLKKLVAQKLPESWHTKYLPALKRVKKALGGWLKAQLKLSLVTWGIVTVGFLLLRIPYGPAWAVLVAVVDAVPILGTGTILVPWAVICLLQGENLRAIGLLCTYGAAAMTRTVLEPRLMGKQLGMDPLATLIALYAGYRFWGIPGLLFTPILASAAKSLLIPER